MILSMCTSPMMEIQTCSPDPAVISDIGVCTVVDRMFALPQLRNCSAGLLRNNEGVTSNFEKVYSRRT